jgi:hypothetical protein
LRSECANPRRDPGSYRIRHRPLPCLFGAPVLHRFDGSVHGIAVMGRHAHVAGAPVKDSNDKPPYRHWHTVCVACGKITLARPCKMPGDIEPIEHNPVVRCQHCEDTRQYLDKDCFLAPLSAAGSSDKSGGTVAVVAGLIAAVKLARGSMSDLARLCTHRETGSAFARSFNRAAWKAAPASCAGATDRTTPSRCYRGTRLIATRRSPAQAR